MPNRTRDDLTAERLRDLLDYDPETGVFRWRVDRVTNRCAGRVAGSLGKGYLKIRIDGVNCTAPGRSVASIIAIRTSSTIV